MNIATTYHQSSEARINDLLASNNALLERARKAEYALKNGVEMEVYQTLDIEELSALIKHLEGIRLLKRRGDQDVAALNLPETEDGSHLQPFGFAPGDYFGQCHNCGGTYLGAKRSFTCYLCATEKRDELKKAHGL